ncbi:hypothetical protein CDD83_1477 [Cordyceps sp. RAO-2017]|nr:hypothetical protein CDD83_1477 [Cordyceps sp. RAO-2017]
MPRSPSSLANLVSFSIPSAPAGAAGQRIVRQRAQAEGPAVAAQLVIAGRLKRHIGVGSQQRGGSTVGPRASHGAALAADPASGKLEANPCQDSPPRSVSLRPSQPLFVSMSPSSAGYAYRVGTCRGGQGPGHGWLMRIGGWTAGHGLRGISTVPYPDMPHSTAGGRCGDGRCAATARAAAGPREARRRGLSQPCQTPSMYVWLYV